MENKLVKALKDEAKHPDSKIGASIFNKYAAKIEKADKEDYRKILKDMERELINTYPDTFSGDDEITNSFMASILKENKLVKALKDEARQPFSKEFLRMQKLAGVITENQYKAKLNENPERGYIVKGDVDFQGNLIEPYVDYNKFIPYFENLLSQAGYEVPQDLLDTIDEIALDGDLLEINDEFPLEHWENFNIQNAKDMVNEFIKSYPEEFSNYNSVEDFKTR